MLSFALTAKALEPGDVIINEVRFNSIGTGAESSEAVELLVVADKVNLNGLQISDRNEWNKETEEQCILNDLNQGFLTNVRSGTLLVIYAGKGEDKTTGADFTITLHVKSSLFCNASPTGKGFALHNQGDNLHLLHNGRQIDFVKYATQDRRKNLCGDPGSLKWEGGELGYIDISSTEITGFRFMGNTVEWNDHPAIWQTYSHVEDDNLGSPNGGRNTEWINLLRAESTFNQSASKELLPSDRP